jgi:uncharacterized protein
MARTVIILLSVMLVKFIIKHKRLLGAISIGSLAIVNLGAYLGAYVMTHTHPAGASGLSLPRPISRKLPSDVGLKYTTIQLPIGTNEWLETWSIPAETATAKGTVLLFPGHLSSKGKELIAVARVFHRLGYDCLMVDYRGVGGSSGDTTTLGAKEAKDVAIAMQYTRQQQPKNPIILYGLSMGSASILTAIAQEQISPDAIVLELPYARLTSALGSRVGKNTRLPLFPTTELLVFWGGVQHGFNGFTHNPVDFARQVKCPTLIMNGKLDPWTSQLEIDGIFNNIKTSKQLVTFDRAGHDLLVSVDRQLWEKSVERFLDRVDRSSIQK